MVPQASTGRKENDMSTMSRRNFLSDSALLAGVSFLPFRPASARTDSSTLPLKLVSYQQIQLNESLFRRQFDQNQDLFLHLDNDALLKPFRQRAGQKAPGPDMGGWYDNSDDFSPADNFHGFVAGHSFGQYVSGLSRGFAATAAKATQEKVQTLVRAYAETLEGPGHFFENYRLPAYTFDKTCCGLLDAHEFAGDPIALEVLWKTTQSALPYLPDRALNRVEQRNRPHKDVSYTWDESYTLPENLFLAFQRSGDRRYRELATRYIEDDFFLPLARGENVLPGEHAYSHINALSSAVQSYLNLNKEEYLRAAVNGFRMVQQQSFATGGWGPDETFVVPGTGSLEGSLGTTHSGFETPCGAYGHFKIARYLLRLTRDSRYGDSMERVLLNTIAGAFPVQPDGTSFYYSDYNNQSHKVHHRDKWPCCSGTFPQLSADYGISSYFQGQDGFYVNLFLPSSFSWVSNGAKCTLHQKTDYPFGNTVEFELELSRSEPLVLYFRIPAWAGPQTRVSINGRPASAELTPGRFLSLSRTWSNQDHVLLEFDMPLRLEAIEAKSPNTVALIHGPLVLFPVGDLPTGLTRKDLSSAVPLSDSSKDWILRAQGREVTLRPFASILNEQYRLYFEL
jgi:uncharacterized protein